MATTVTKIPAVYRIPPKADPELARFAESVKEVLEVRLGRRGDPRDRAVTLRELINSGMAEELLDNPFDPDTGTGTIDFKLAGGKHTQITSGTFAPHTWGGFSAVPSGKMRYQIIGDTTHKYVFITTADTSTAITGTSNATGFTWAGIPAVIRPDHPVASSVCAATNAGYVGQGSAIAQIAADGSVVMAMQNTSAWFLDAGWTNSAAKGFPANFVLMYPLKV